MPNHRVAGPSLEGNDRLRSEQLRAEPGRARTKTGPTCPPCMGESASKSKVLQGVGVQLQTRLPLVAGIRYEGSASQGRGAKRIPKGALVRTFGHGSLPKEASSQA